MELLRGPTRGDVAIATILVAYTVFETVTLDVIQPKAPALVTGVLSSAIMAYRRVHPLLVAAGIAVLSVAASVAGVPIDASGIPLFTWILTIFSLVTLLDLPRALLGMGIFLVSLATSGGAADASPENMAFGLVFASLALGFGLSVRRHTSEAVRLREEALRHEAELDRESQEAADRERSRIARELHDVISHSVSVMVVQAGAAERVLARDTGAAARAMQAVQLTGRQALTELAGLLGVLRNGGDDIGLAPQPGLADLASLARSAGATGLTVDLETPPSDLADTPPGVQLAVYRIVQESLTNVAKHSCARTARVTVSVSHDEVRTFVEDPGPAREPDAGDGLPRDGGADPQLGSRGGGNGLRGIRERAQVYGGAASAGPTRAGGFRVEAWIPRGGTA